MSPQRRSSFNAPTQADQDIMHDIYNPFGLFPSKPVLVHQSAFPPPPLKHIYISLTSVLADGIP